MRIYKVHGGYIGICRSKANSEIRLINYLMLIETMILAYMPQREELSGLNLVRREKKGKLKGTSKMDNGDGSYRRFEVTPPRSTLRID